MLVDTPRLYISLPEYAAYLMPTDSAIGKTYLSKLYSDLEPYLECKLNYVKSESDFKDLISVNPVNRFIIIDKYDLYRSRINPLDITRLANSNFVLIDAKFRGFLYTVLECEVLNTKVYRKEDGRKLVVEIDSDK